MQTIAKHPEHTLDCIVTRPICVDGERVEVGTAITLPRQIAYELMTANRVARATAAPAPAPRAAKAPKAKPAEAPAPEPTE